MGATAPSYRKKSSKYHQVRNLWVCGLLDTLNVIWDVIILAFWDKFCSQLFSFPSTEVLGWPNAGVAVRKWTNLVLILISPHTTYFNRGSVVYMRIDYFLLHTVKFPKTYAAKTCSEKVKGIG